MIKWLLFLLIPVMSRGQNTEVPAWIRINQLGYTPGGIKAAVWGIKQAAEVVTTFHLVEQGSGKIVYTASAGRNFGAYGPFQASYRLSFTSFKKPGRYFIQTANAISPAFDIGDHVYKGSADFCLRYMRQQRTGFNPFLKDSCHTHDGYVLYGQKSGIIDSTEVDVVGGWHDASDYLQYATTSANATYHLLAAYRDFPLVFTDKKQANGLDGINGMADVLDEAKWGLDWLLKMHPRPDWMFNQIADDRDHMGMRIPKQDSFYGKGFMRPVYFLSGEPQQRGKFMNATTGTSSTAGKFASAFALGSRIFKGLGLPYGKRVNEWAGYSSILLSKAFSAFSFGRKMPGVAQTASVRSPYIYAEDNWTDDMELAAVSIYNADDPHSRQRWFIHYADSLAKLEPITPWLGKDTARHYQWYPFINPGHYELAKRLTGKDHQQVVDFYRQGIRRVWERSKENAFYRGIPFIWCSNNLAASFAIQCYWYRDLTGDTTYAELEQANIDWLFGCNPWGTSMVYGLPAWGDTPVDPHSAFTHLGKFPIDGGLVDGPVYGSIYKSLIGIKLYQPDEYADLQSDLAVYHDDYGDYSTNEPTMDGTASLIYLLAAKEAEAASTNQFSTYRGAIIRGDSTQRRVALVFTGHEFAEGRDYVAEVLDEEHIKASFFFTGDYYRNPDFRKNIRQLRKEGHYLGAHSDKHLLYCDWEKRDSLLITKKQFNFDLADNYTAMARHGIDIRKARYFLPPYEWYNDSIAKWTADLQLQLINFTPGTRTTADYTWPGLKNYIGSTDILESIADAEIKRPAGLNGFMLLLHLGTDPKRTDKFYKQLPELIRYLKDKGYQFQRVDELLHRKKE